jgi:hypothetical protein
LDLLDERLHNGPQWWRIDYVEECGVGVLQRCGREAALELLALDEILDFLKVANKLVVVSCSDDWQPPAQHSSMVKSRKRFVLLTSLNPMAIVCQHTNKWVASLSSNVPELGANILVLGISSIEVLDSQLLDLMTIEQCNNKLCQQQLRDVAIQQSLTTPPYRKPAIQSLLVLLLNQRATSKADENDDGSFRHWSATNDKDTRMEGGHRSRASNE